MIQQESYEDVGIDYVLNQLKRLDSYTNFRNKKVLGDYTYLEFAVDKYPDDGSIKVFDNSDGTEVAQSYYDKEYKSSPYYKASIDVRPDKRRQKIATNIYTWIEELTGGKLQPDLPHSDKASKFWAQPNRPFGERELSEMIRGVLRKSLLNEDEEHFQNMQSSIEDKLKDSSSAYAKNGKLAKREIQEYLKVLYKQYGIKPVKFLGAGYHGYAFLTDDGKTLKITRDKTEAVEANKIKNSNAKHFQKIYNIFKIKVGDGKTEDIYALLKEHILQNKSLIKQLIELNDLSYRYLSKVKLDNGGYFPTTLDLLFKTENENLFEFFIDYVKKENSSKLLLWYLLQMRSLHQEMKKLGIKTDDVGGANLGLKNKTLINIDAGYGDYGDGWIEKQPYHAQVAQENKKL